MGCSFPTFAFDDSSADCSHQDFMSKRRTVEFRQGRNWQLKAIGCFCFHRKLSANPPILGKRQNIFWGSVHFSHSVMSNSLWLHGLQHARLPCPSPTPGACSNSYPLSWWHHSTISSCHPLLLLPSIFPSIRVFSNDSVLCIMWPKYWSFNFSISPSNEYSGLISFRIDWLDLLAVQGTLKSLLQHHSSKTLILQCSDFFIVQLFHPYMTIGKTIALTRQTFVGKVCLCFLTYCLGW